MVIFQVSDLRKGMEPLTNWDEKLDFYYDETNNIRRLKLSEVGLNVDDNKIFVIGGIVLEPGQQLSGWDEFRKSVNVQGNADEVKFHHIAQGDYEKVLGSKRLATALEWIDKNNIRIHYSVLDVLFWSIVDIIDSIFAASHFGMIEYHLEIKSEFYYWVNKDKGEFFKLLNDFSYPNVDREEVGEFLEMVDSFLEAKIDRERNPATTMLRRLFTKACRHSALDLTFLHDNEAGELIKDFSAHFMQPIYRFKNGSHTFDTEKFIEKCLAEMEIREAGQRIDYKFVNSKHDNRVQLSDIVVGLLGKHFTFVQSNTIDELRSKKAGFSDTQKHNMNLFRRIIDRSDAYSEGLFLSTMPVEVNIKNNSFLHGHEFPIGLEEQ